MDGVEDEQRRRAAGRARLLARRRRLQQALADMAAGPLGQSLRASLSELSMYDNHPADLATETWRRSQDLAWREQLRLRLREVDAALLRLDGGAYGLCRRCGRPIPGARLAVLPETPYCLTCSAACAQARPAHLRPVDEEVLSPPFGRSFRDGTADVGFDGEDAWQAVARYGSSDPPSDVPGTADPDVLVDAGGRPGSAGPVEDGVGAGGEVWPAPQDDAL